ncbi:MAG: helix-turn-helix transcriptional regulator [Planctomycetes bacterium]|nr:helix-turn-helix transcriptional regulator [Planctomycetota bacterium]
MSSRKYCELLRYRVRKNLSLADLSALCGLSIATLWRLERGVTKPTARTLVKLQDALNLTPEETQRLTAIAAGVPMERGQKSG